MATLKLEVGKTYRTERGDKVGPMGLWNDGLLAEFRLFDAANIDGQYWSENGMNCDGPGGDVPGDRFLDLIAEWTDAPTGPVRTVTRKAIVPGTYSGGVTVVSADDLIAGCRVSIATALGHADAGQLRAAIATLTEIADALEEQA